MWHLAGAPITLEHTPPTVNANSNDVHMLTVIHQIGRINLPCCTCTVPCSLCYRELCMCCNLHLPQDPCTRDNEAKRPHAIWMHACLHDGSMCTCACHIRGDGHHEVCMLPDSCSLTPCRYVLSRTRARRCCSESACMEGQKRGLRAASKGSPCTAAAWSHTGDDSHARSTQVRGGNSDT